MTWFSQFTYENLDIAFRTQLYEPTSELFSQCKCKNVYYELSMEYEFDGLGSAHGATTRDRFVLCDNVAVMVSPHLCKGKTSLAQIVLLRGFAL